ncbi:hypothetical protein [Fulvivirga lutimaris]|uniref:hypothetical protein n=1 Tax=Fulvivirga lutimaris TaxID=1819566 RepID=UPI0012BC88CF|nr:hypothetical protein [Fulvivirga lutimaris]MTI41903.1 hypothetical protein [Fulvivirga lutimaris]
MRKLQYLLVVFLIGLMSCGSDDDGGTPNKILINGDAFETNFNSITGVAQDGEGHAGISFSSVTTSGDSKTLTIDVEYDGTSKLGGTYSFPQGDNLYLDDFLTNYSVFVGSSYDGTNLSEGTVTVTKNNGDNYTVEMDLLMDDGTTFTGTITADFIVTFNNG